MRSDESNSPILRRAGERGLRERSLHGDDGTSVRWRGGGRCGDGVRGERWPAPLPDQDVDHGGHEAVAHTPRS